MPTLQYGLLLFLFPRFQLGKTIIFLFYRLLQIFTEGSFYEMRLFCMYRTRCCDRLFFFSHQGEHNAMNMKMT